MTLGPLGLYLFRFDDVGCGKSLASDPRVAFAGDYLLLMPEMGQVHWTGLEASEKLSREL